MSNPDNGYLDKYFVFIKILFCDKQDDSDKIAQHMFSCRYKKTCISYFSMKPYVMGTH